MSRYPCSGCGLRQCDGRCYLESPADYPELALPNRRKIQERRWLNERRGHVPVIDRVNYPAISEHADPLIRSFEQ